MNEQIRKVKKAADVARPIFIEYKGVLGVGYGYKRTRSQITDELAIVVWVEKKLLSEDVTSGQHIPAHFAGYPTDVEVVRFNTVPDEDDSAGLHEGRPLEEFLDWGKIHRLNVSQKGGNRNPYPKTGADEPKMPEFNSPEVEVRDDLFIIEDDGSLFYVTAEDEKVFDFKGAWRLFRNEFDDHYDFVAFYFDDSDDNLPRPRTCRFISIFRDSAEAGYGKDAKNERHDWQDSNRLLGFAYYTWFHRRSLIHEIGHYWLFNVNYRLTPDSAERLDLHQDWYWNVEQAWSHPGTNPDTDRSPMPYHSNDWVQDTDDDRVFHLLPSYEGSDWSDASSFRFSPLEQYLMGFLHKEAVASSPVVPPHYPPAGGEYQIICAEVGKDPDTGLNVDYEPHPLRTITVENVIYNEGERIPAHLESQRVFHMAVIALTYNRNASAAFLDRAEVRRTIHAETWRLATEGRSVIDASLLRPNVDDLYIRDNTSDVGNNSSSGAFWDSPDIFVRRCEEHVDNFLDPDIPNASIHEIPLANQDNWLYARISNRSSTPYQNVRVNFFVANFNGFGGRDTVAEAIPRTEVIYPVDWHPESVIGTDLLDAVPANGTAVARARWPQSLVPPADWHPCLLVEIIPLGPEPRRLHHVWENRKLAQKNITIDYVQGEVCPNPTPSGPYRYYLPFTFGHTLTTSRKASIELERNVDDPHLTVYLDPADALATLYRIGNTLYHLVPPERDEGAGGPASKLHDLVPRSTTGGVVIDIPAGTELGVQCGTCEKSLGEGMNLRFCDDTRVMLSCKTPDYTPIGLIPVEGFEYEFVEGRSMLKMTDPHRASFPVSLIEKKEYQMGLLVKGDENTVKMPVRVRIKQRNEKGRVVGGIDFEARPCKPKKEEPILY